MMRITIWQVPHPPYPPKPKRTATLIAVTLTALALTGCELEPADTQAPVLPVPQAYSHPQGR